MMHYVNLKVNYSWIEIRGLKNFISKEKNCYKHVDVFIICFTSIIACQLFFFFKNHLHSEIFDFKQYEGF